MCSTAPVTSGESTYTLELPYRRSVGPGRRRVPHRPARPAGPRQPDRRRAGDRARPRVRPGHRRRRRRPRRGRHGRHRHAAGRGCTSRCASTRSTTRSRGCWCSSTAPTPRSSTPSTSPTPTPSPPACGCRSAGPTSGSGHITDIACFEPEAALMSDAARRRGRRRARPVHAAAHRPRLRRCACSPLAPRFGEQLRSGRDRRPAVPVVRPRVTCRPGRSARCASSPWATRHEVELADRGHRHRRSPC